MIPFPDVPTCVTQVYRDDKGRWWRYCLTCDDGSNKYGRHLRGHKTEADAQMSARDHVKAKTRSRMWREWMRQWRKAICAAETWDEFVSVWRERERHLRGHWPALQFDDIPADQRERVMREVKSTYQEGSE